MGEAAEGDATAYRHYWELCTLLALRDGLRSGDVFVPGSRRYDNPTAYLFTPAQWGEHRVEFCYLVGKSPDASEALPLVMDELEEALADLEETLKRGDGPVRLNDDGELVIPPLTAEDIPTEAEELHGELERMLPNVPIASLLVEMDRHTGFLDCFTHAGGKQAPLPTAEAEPDRLPDRAVHEPRAARDGLLVRHPVRRAVVHPRGVAA
ncbi:hypothetical protein [Streptomyces althioticus]|uniref:hypothetical protein n=1 Tax=Streptomyces althioticus TaxID=83380 RepID=UPI0037CE5EB4